MRTRFFYRLDCVREDSDIGAFEGLVVAAVAGIRFEALVVSVVLSTETDIMACLTGEVDMSHLMNVSNRLESLGHSVHALLEVYVAVQLPSLITRI